MASDHSQARKKQSNQKKPRDGARQERDKESKSSSSILLWSPLVIALCAFAYLNPTVITDVLDSWIGFSEHWDATPTSAAGPQTWSQPKADNPRRDAVVAAFKHAWGAYERDAMGADEYHPLSHNGSNLSKAGGIGYTVVDSMDTMQLMGLDAEFSRARQWVEEKLTFERDDKFSTFEARSLLRLTTIRVLGGLLSTYHLSGQDPLFLSKAVELADRLLPMFDTPSGLPRPLINLAKREAHDSEDFTGLASVAEVGTLQLEFRYLSYLTGNDVYWRKVENIMRVVKSARLPHGLASIFMDIDEGVYVTSAISLGSRADSYYEYLLKQYIQTNGTEDVYRDLYDDAMDGAHNYLIQKTQNGQLTYTAELVPERENSEGEITWRLTPKQDHLACFFGGSLMLGATRTGATVHPLSIPPRAGELSEKGLRDWKAGVELVKTCMHTHDTATGLSPEIVYFRVASDGMDVMPNAPPDWYIKGAQIGEFPPYDARYMLRPETVESLFLAYRLTGDAFYRDEGWRVFQAIEKHCRVPSGGYATVVNVDEAPARQEDMMETFFLSETLKYLFLLFSDADVLPLDKYVFNTEAHPLPVFDSPYKTGFN